MQAIATLTALGLFCFLGSSTAIAKSVTFTDSDLSSGSSFTKDGLRIDSIVSNGGTQNNIASGQFQGLWYAQNISSSGQYDLNFNKPIFSIEINFDALSGGTDFPGYQPERIFNFQTSTAPVAIAYSDRGGTSFIGQTITATAADGKGTIKYSNVGATTFPFTSFGFTHTQDVYMNGFVIEGITAQTATPLYLSFGTAVSRDYYVKERLFGGGSYMATKSGSEAAATFSAHERSTIMKDVQAIFDRSNIGIYVTDTKPTDPALTVHFAKPLPFYDHDGDGTADRRLLGQAYDIVSPSLFGSSIDRFDRRKDGNVAVFMDTTTDSIASIVETVAHEAAHGYGARHINPGSCGEVMDYCSSPSPYFSTSPSPIVEPPISGSTPSDETHNPAYHLRRYAVGESAADIGLTAGTWDKEGFTLFGMQFSFSELSMPILDLSIISSQSSSFVGDDTFSVAQLISSYYDGSAPLSLDLNTAGVFEIFGSSSDTSVADIYFLPAEFDGVNFGISVSDNNNGIQFGRVARYDSASETFIDIGNFELSIVTTAVPEPPMSAIFLIGCAFVLFANRRRQLSLTRQ